MSYLDQWQPPKPPSTHQEFAARATDILKAIIESQAPHDDAAYIGHWSRLIELCRARETNGLNFRIHDRGPWTMRVPGYDHGSEDMQFWLAGGAHNLPVRMPATVQAGDVKLIMELAMTLNGAGVQPPVAAANQ